MQKSARRKTRTQAEQCSSAQREACSGVLHAPSGSREEEDARGVERKQNLTQQLNKTNLTKKRQSKFISLHNITSAARSSPSGVASGTPDVLWCSNILVVYLL